MKFLLLAFLLCSGCQSLRTQAPAPRTATLSWGKFSFSYVLPPPSK